MNLKIPVIDWSVNAENTTNLRLKHYNFYTILQREREEGQKSCWGKKFFIIQYIIQPWKQENLQMSYALDLLQHL